MRVGPRVECSVSRKRGGCESGTSQSVTVLLQSMINVDDNYKTIKSGTQDHFFSSSQYYAELFSPSILVSSVMRHNTTQHTSAILSRDIRCRRGWPTRWVGGLR